MDFFLTLADSRGQSSSSPGAVKSEADFTDEEIDGAAVESPKHSEAGPDINANNEQIVKVERAPSPPIASSPRNDEVNRFVVSSHKRKSPSPARLLTTASMPPSLPLQLTPPLSADVPQPLAKMPRIEDSAVQRKQSQHSLELLCRLYPEQKRGVLELILKGCNYDLVQSIECILPSHERAIQQLSTLPSQSFTLSNGHHPSSDHGIRSYAPMPPPPHHGNNKSPKLPPTSSAFQPFPSVPQHGHGYGGSCECNDCLKHPNPHHRTPHSPKGLPMLSSSKPNPQQPTHRMVPYVPVSSHNPISEPVKICAGCGGKMKLEDQRCPNCEPEAKS